MTTEGENPVPESKPPTIFEALASVMADVSHVAKRDRNEHSGFNFRGIDAVVNAVGPALRAHNVIVVPVVKTVAYDAVHTSTGKMSSACRVLVDYVFYGPAGDSITATVQGEAWDAGDKATPKAMSVAFRTALLQALALPTDDPDPDASTYERVAPPQLATPAQQERIGALMGEANLTTPEGQMEFATKTLNRPVNGPGELTVTEFMRLEAALKERIAGTDQEGEAQ